MPYRTYHDASASKYGGASEAEPPQHLSTWVGPQCSTRFMSKARLFTISPEPELLTGCQTSPSSLLRRAAVAIGVASPLLFVREFLKISLRKFTVGLSALAIVLRATLGAVAVSANGASIEQN